MKNFFLLLSSHKRTKKNLESNFFFIYCGLLQIWFEIIISSTSFPTQKKRSFSSYMAYICILLFSIQSRENKRELVWIIATRSLAIWFDFILFFLGELKSIRWFWVLKVFEFNKSFCTKSLQEFSAASQFNFISFTRWYPFGFIFMEIH